MGISVFWARSQANDISGNASELRTIKSKLENIKGDINNGWTAEEIAYVNSAIDAIGQKLTNLATKLDGISSDIVAAAEQIKREEDAARAAAEARARAEAEARAKAAAEKASARN